MTSNERLQCDFHTRSTRKKTEERSGQHKQYTRHKNARFIVFKVTDGKKNQITAMQQLKEAHEDRTSFPWPNYQ